MKAGVHLPSDKVPLITKLAFGAGDVGPAIVSAIMGFFLLYFLTDVARISPALAGAVLLITKLWDSINDPIVGMLSDRIRTPWGRRRPWFLFGAIPFGLSFFLLFLVPPLGETGKFWYYLIVALMLDTAFTVVNVPYTALTPELTDDYDERTILNSYRFSFSITGGLIAAVLHPVVVDTVIRGGGSLQTGYAVSALLWATVATLPFFLAFFGTYERGRQQDELAPVPFMQGLKVTFGNRAFRYVAGIFLLSWLALQTVQTVMIYYVTYWLRRPELMAPVILAVQGSALVWLLIWTRVSRRIGKKGVYYRGMFFWIGVLLMLFAVGSTAPAWLILMLGALAGVGVATAYLVPWAMLPDVIELDELQTGQRREGAYYGFFVLLQKLGLAVNLFLVGQLLTLTGYITPPPGIAEPLVQPASTLLAIRLLVGPVPAVMLVVAIVLVHRFPITKEQHERTLAALARRRSGMSMATSSMGGASPLPDGGLAVDTRA